MKNTCLPSQQEAVLDWNFLGKEALVGCNLFFFHFGSENWEEQVKKTTLYNIYQVAEFFKTVKWKSSFSFVLSKLNLHPLRNIIENARQRFSDLFVTVLVPIYLKNSVKKASSVLIFFRWGLFFTQSLKILTMAILVLNCLAYDSSKTSCEKSHGSVFKSSCGDLLFSLNIEESLHNVFSSHGEVVHFQVSNLLLWTLER